MINRIIYLLFLTVSFLEIVAEYLNLGQLVYFTKPLLMPILMAYVIYNVNVIHKKPKVQLLVALLFSMLGDTFLMFSPANEMFFLIGLSMFLITHIFYILFFISQKTNKIKIHQVILYIALIVLYYSGLMALIDAKLSHYAIPVYVYGLVLCVMLYSAFTSSFQKQKLIIVTGAILFVLSDSLIAVSKFYMSESNELINSGIMLTYIFGQFLIVFGATKYLRLSRI
jgi:uncharacterized membrane protein YhhN